MNRLNGPSLLSSRHLVAGDIMTARIKKLETELQSKLYEPEPCDEQWIPIVGEECSIVFGGTKEQCTVLALHKHHAWITAGETEAPLTVVLERLIRKEG